jgi:hypothetical protein
MPSPKGTNKSRAFILPMKMTKQQALALDAELNNRARFSADLPDEAKGLKTGEDDGPDDPRARLLNWIDQKIEAGNDAEVAGLLEQLEGGGARGRVSSDQTSEMLKHFLRGKGMSDDDIRTACDLARDVALGIGSSARRGGAFNQGAGGALSEQRGQFNRPTETPASRDACLEEELGIEPAKDYRNRRMDGRDARRVGRDERMSFDYAYGMLPTIEAARPRRRRSERAMANDAAASDHFARMFPEAARIGTSEHDCSKHRR